MTSRSVLILVILLIARCASADVNDAFEEMTASKSDSITQALLRKHYDEAVTLINSWLATYESLPPEKRLQYKQQKLNGQYLAVCTHAARGDLDIAIDEFATLVSSGYANFKQASTDRRLKRLRGNEQFEELLRIVEQRGDFLAVLKSAGPYKAQKAQKEIRFTYPRTDPNLERLRTLYALDSIAGNGEEHSRIIKLMRWVHATIPYNGMREDAPTSSALDLLAMARGGKELNCRDVAIVLKDIYQAVGFPSRYVYCMPKDTLDPDCHVVTIVFSRSQNKWVMMDPANDAYLMDERGRLLGLDEIRERAKAAKPITLNKEANQNGKPVVIEDYLFNYLVKNLYWFESPLSSAYNYESAAAEKAINFARLYPTGYGATGFIRHQYGTSYITRDATVFWKVPAIEP